LFGIVLLNCLLVLSKFVDMLSELRIIALEPRKNADAAERLARQNQRLTAVAPGRLALCRVRNDPADEKTMFNEIVIIRYDG
jgi:hypothetical protein